jgi:hypothetical protein
MSEGDYANHELLELQEFSVGGFTIIIGCIVEDKVTAEFNAKSSS